MSFEDFPRFDQFKGRTILAIDYGRKVTGLASYCPGREPFPQPYGRIIYKSDEQVCDVLYQIIEDEFIEVFVVGIPLHADGTDSEMTKRVRRFGELLTARYPKIELHFQDETLTSYAAEERMKSSPRYDFKVDPKQIDAVAASIILEDFMRETKG